MKGLTRGINPHKNAKVAASWDLSVLPWTYRSTPPSSFPLVRDSVRAHWISSRFNSGISNNANELPRKFICFNLFFRISGGCPVPFRRTHAFQRGRFRGISAKKQKEREKRRLAETATQKVIMLDAAERISSRVRGNSRFANKWRKEKTH
ncbi:hypothetical protein NPIL_235001 [Nephila pilipes]|uniref:Uncharacterized protein n=1 Tax=Nephila pilipes TaxID=299642 RepID=A0A8X6M7T2_NEPPI|nr:hypothetical protein NPIL_235001 [Nephila pilipes]